MVPQPLDFFERLLFPRKRCMRNNRFKRDMLKLSAAWIGLALTFWFIPAIVNEGSLFLGMLLLFSIALVVYTMTYHCARCLSRTSTYRNRVCKLLKIDYVPVSMFWGLPHAEAEFTLRNYVDEMVAMDSL
jgi:hypothetical protein